MHHSPGFFFFLFLLSDSLIQVCSIPFPFSQTMVLKSACVLWKEKQELNSRPSPRRTIHLTVHCIPPASTLTGFGSICLASCCTIAERPLKRRLSNIYNGWYFQSVLICCNSFCPLLEEWRWRVRLVNGLLCVKGIYTHLGSARSCFLNKGLIN